MSKPRAGGPAANQREGAYLPKEEEPAGLFRYVDWLTEARKSQEMGDRGPKKSGRKHMTINC